MSRPQPRTVLVVLACVAACVAPLVLSDLTFFMRMVMAAIVVTGLSLLMGYSGQASLGQGAFVAAGALTVAVGTTKLGLPPLVALLIAPLVAAAFAALVGVPLLRLHGHYLAFGTLALLLMVQAAMGTFDVLGGAFGISGIPPLGVGDRVFVGQLPYVYLALGCLGLVLLLSHRTVHSRFGRGIQALAGSQTAAESAGVPVNRSKVTVFALSAGYAGLAGGLSAFFTPYVSPDSFPALESFTYVIMAVVGGLGTIWGGVVGAVIVSVLLQVLNTVSSQPGLPPTAAPIMQYATYGALLVLALLFMPRGIVPTVDGGVDRVLARQRVGVRRMSVPLASAAGEPARDRDVTLLYLIKQVELAVRQALDDVVAAADLTTLQYTALTVLERHPGITSAELARNSFVRAQTMAEMVTYLLGRGLVARERDEKNRKQYLLS